VKYDDTLCSKNLALKNVDELNLFNNKFVYLNAQHISPSFEYDISNWKNNDINYLGNFGQFVFPYISLNSNKLIDKIFLDDSNDGDLLSALNHWLGLVSRGIQIKCDVNNDFGKAKVMYIYKYADGVSSSLRNSLNVGYGITHVISLIYALLSSDNKTLLIIENPESHLHPKAQSVIGKLIALAAKNGAQIICETHSDHIINSIRLVVKDGVLEPRLCNVVYFYQDENYNTKKEIIDIDEKGNFDNYPEGFLDEWDNAIVKLV
jgi:predicted ATPase